jgi:hypothetical protein
MTRYEARQYRRQVALDDVKVSAADSAGEYFEEDVAWPKPGTRYIFDCERG